MNARVLMVDDEPLVLEGFRRQLRNHVDLQIAVGGSEGLAKLGQGDPYAVVISDMRMPQMNGAAFLEQVRQQAPDSVRMILSGQSELEATIAAVNRGQIFRFLTKPCTTEELLASIEAGVAQYRLVTGQRELLENTLRGAIEVLTEILSLTNPLAHRRARRIAHFARQVARELKLRLDWQAEIACLVSQIGCITLPEEVISRLCAGQDLDAVEAQLYESHPELAGRLLAGIPRLDGVARIVRGQHGELSAMTYAGEPLTWPEEQVATFLLRVAAEFERALGAGRTRRAALDRIDAIFPGLTPQVRQTLHGVKLDGAAKEILSIRAMQLQTGMVLDEDLCSTKGTLLASKGQELTQPLIYRLQAIAEGGGFNEPFRVQVAI